MMGKIYALYAGFVGFWMLWSVSGLYGMAFGAFACAAGIVIIYAQAIRAMLAYQAELKRQSPF